MTTQRQRPRRKRYRARPRINLHCGCLGCSLPLLAFVAAVVAVIVLA